MANQNLEKDMKKFYASSKPYLNQLKSHGLEDYRKYINKILKYLKKGATILDVGCGVGQVSNFLASKGYEVIGIDLSPLFVKEAKKTGKAKFKAMDSTDLIFKDNTFDSIISAETLEHIPNPEKALKELCRVLKKSGILVLRYPNKISPLNNLLIRITRKPKWKMKTPRLEKDVAGDDDDLCYIGSTSDVIVFLKNKGFQILFTKPFFWPSALIVAKKPRR